jgi:hypothetical protein
MAFEATGPRISPRSRLARPGHDPVRAALLVGLCRSGGLDGRFGQPTPKYNISRSAELLTTVEPFPRPP